MEANCLRLRNFTNLGRIFLSFLLLVCQEFGKLNVVLYLLDTNDPQRSLKIDRPLCARRVTTVHDRYSECLVSLYVHRVSEKNIH